MAAYEIPLSPQPQTFSISLAGVAYNITLLWRESPVGGGWFIDLADASGNAILAGIPLVTGVDLLAQHKHLGIKAQLWVATDGVNYFDTPTFQNIGVSSHLYFVTA
jgi:hypothetical protein